MRYAIADAQPERETNNVNLTPMLDVVFILLIFFIVTASFIRESGIDLSRPDGAARPVSEDGAILITIDENDGIWMETRLIDPRAVRANIERQQAEMPGAKLVIQAHSKSSNKTLVGVMDASRMAGVYGISIASDDH